MFFVVKKSRGEIFNQINLDKIRDAISVKLILGLKGPD